VLLAWDKIKPPDRDQREATQKAAMISKVRVAG
jgi:hypothetical protein